MRAALRRLLLSAPVAALIVGLLAPAAAAAPPQSVDVTFEREAGVACTFPIRVSITGKEKVIESEGRTKTIGIGQKATVTNLDTGASTRLNISGTIVDVEQPDGSELSRLRGRNLLVAPPIADEAFALLTVGNFSLTSQFDPAAGTLDIERPTGNGRLVDVCGLVD